MRLAAMGGVAVALIGFFIFVSLRLSAPEMTLLYRDLETSDSADIVAQLEERQVPYELQSDGATILVPADQVDRMRLAMAESGLPSGGNLGYEIFDEADGFGVTSFVQNINRLRALEGELARTVSTIQNVRQARVHLVLPERQLFTREQMEPTASVFLRLAGGGLSNEQVRAVQHLVAASVPNLQPQDISIVDDRGNLLASGPSGDDQDVMLMNAEEMRVSYEQRLTEEVEQLLSRSLGFGSVRARVSVEMDFNRVTSTEETFDPDSQVARSSQFIQDTEQSNEGVGPDPVSVAENLPEADVTGALGGAGATAQSERTEESNNFEINRRIETREREAGEVRRLSVAVLVDGTYGTAADGSSVYAPRSAEELAQITALVRSAVGFSEARGDSVEVVNMQFTAGIEDMFEEQPELFMGLTREDLLRLAEMVVLGIVAVLVILLVVRPLLARVLEGDNPDDIVAEQLMGPDGQLALTGPGIEGLLTGPDSDEEEEDALDGLIDINKVEGRVRASSLRKIGEICEKHPEEAVSIIRSWLYQDG